MLFCLNMSSEHIEGGKRMIDELLFKLLFRLLKGYHIFFFVKGTAYYVNDIMIDSEFKEIILKYEDRGSE